MQSSIPTPESTACLASELPALRQEIMQAQATRIDLLKWKLALVSGLGAAGLGLQVSGGAVILANVGYLLAMIPLVCAYVDLLLQHTNLRILVIARFLREQQDIYEVFCHVKRNIYVLEDWALKTSTRFLCLAVAAYGLAKILLMQGAILEMFGLDPVPSAHALARQGVLGATLFISGTFGWWLSWWLQRTYHNLIAEQLSPAITPPRQLQSVHAGAAASLADPLVVQQVTLLDIIQNHYSACDIQTLRDYLSRHGTFNFPVLNTGLFPAAVAGAELHYTGYQHVWVRDNIYVAYAHFINNHPVSAVTCVRSLAVYFKKNLHRFDNIIDGKISPQPPTNRPQVRFDGERLAELEQPWAHAQNDALGYFVWLFCKLILAGALLPTADDIALLAHFVLYFQAIRFWEDEDSGHWEETRKIQASSIGAVTAGLRELNRVLAMPAVPEHFCYQSRRVGEALVATLIHSGSRSLDAILPRECRQTDAHKARAYDAALLFLIFPLNIVSDTMADTILADVIEHLQGEYGVRRYNGDSFWSADYTRKFAPQARTADFSETLDERDRLLVPGEEAQWCIFDPIISIIYGCKYQRQPSQSILRDQQIKYLNRALGQLTGDSRVLGALKCPELYYVAAGKRVPNDATPLLWAQANLWMALQFMEQSATITES